MQIGIWIVIVALVVLLVVAIAQSTASSSGSLLDELFATAKKDAEKQV